MNREEQARWEHTRMMLMAYADSMPIEVLDNVIASLKYKRKVKNRPDQNQMDAALQKAKKLLVAAQMDNCDTQVYLTVRVEKPVYSVEQYDIPLEDLVTCIEKDVSVNIDAYYLDVVSEERDTEDSVAYVSADCPPEYREQFEDLLKHLDVYDFADRAG